MLGHAVANIIFGILQPNVSLFARCDSPGELGIGDVPGGAIVTATLPVRLLSEPARLAGVFNGHANMTTPSE